MNHKVQGGAGHGPIIAFKAEFPACVVNEKIHSASFVTRRQLQLTRQRRPSVLRIENALARPRRALRIVHGTKRPSFGKMTVTTHIIEPICRLAYRNKSIKERRSFQKMNTKERGCFQMANGKRHMLYHRLHSFRDWTQNRQGITLPRQARYVPACRAFFRWGLGNAFSKDA